MLQELVHTDLPVWDFFFEGPLSDPEDDALHFGSCAEVDMACEAEADFVCIETILVSIGFLGPILNLIGATISTHCICEWFLLEVLARISAMSSEVSTTFGFRMEVPLGPWTSFGSLHAK